MLAVVAPGQGAQKPGFLAPWLEADPLSGPDIGAGSGPGVIDPAALLASFSDAAGVDLAALGTTGDEEALRDTAVAQPLLVASALLSARALGLDPADVVLAGHSVGEFAATALAGVLDDTEAVALVGVRARAMAEASAARPTSMLALLGGAADEVDAAVEASGARIANHNGAGQVVVAGTVEELAALTDGLPRRCRAVPLAVAGAFHTPHMAPAVGALREAAAALTPRDPSGILLTNADGSVVTTGRDALDHLVAQVTHPVRWDACTTTMAERGVTGLLELTPAGTLTGIARRTLEVERFALNTPDELADAREFVATHLDRPTP